YAGHRGTGPAHRRWLGHSDHGNRGRSNHSSSGRRVGRPHRHSACLHSAGHLLPVHRLLRVARLKARSTFGCTHGMIEREFVVGVDIGGTKVAAGLVDRVGEIRSQTRTPMVATGEARAGLDAVISAINRVSNISG